MSEKIFSVTSPLAGTFYRAPSPEEPSFAEVGQSVEVGHVLCIIESMKVFTELRADVSGVVKNIMVEDEEIVARKQKLMEIEMR